MKNKSKVRVGKCKKLTDGRTKCTFSSTGNFKLISFNVVDDRKI